STGVYWRPVYNLLEDHFVLLLVNAQPVFIDTTFARRAPRSLHRPIHEGPAWRTIQQLPIRTIDEVLDNRGKGTATRTQACRAAREFGIRRVELPDRRSLAGLLVEGLPLQARICRLDVASQNSLDQLAHVLPHAALAVRDRLRRRNEARVIYVTEGHSPITCDVPV